MVCESITITRDMTYEESIVAVYNFEGERKSFSFKGINNMASPWPSDFNDKDDFDSWLTGINAFYWPTGNWFTIPVSITQQPFFDVNYPSALNFGGIGIFCILYFAFYVL